MMAEKCIERMADLEALCQRLDDSPRVGFDMEFVPENTYTPELCLLQIAADDFVGAVDLLATGAPMPFWELILAPGREVIVHAGKEELAACRHHTGQVPENVFDVQLAAGFVGMGYPLSYERLVRRVTGQQVNSGETRTDWRKRPLTPQQIAYALDDVRHLLSVRDRLHAEIAQRGREKLVSQAMQKFVHQASDNGENEKFRKVAGAGRLKPRELAVLRELHAWREERASQSNKPVKRVLRDDLLTECALRKPSTPEQLAQIRGLDGISQARWAKGILEAVQRGLTVDEPECPQQSRDRRTPEDQMVLKLLSAMLNHIARAEEITGELIGTNDDLHRLMEWCSVGKPDEARPRLVRGWRADLCGSRLIDLLEGRVGLSIHTGPDGFELAFDESFGVGQQDIPAT